MSRNLGVRRKPTQERAVKRTQQIMNTTATLLSRVGFDDLTTDLITKELGISVGSLYHYFPNKHAILRAIAQNWLLEWDKVLNELSNMPVENMALDCFVANMIDTFLVIYREQEGILPLIQAMYVVPELRDLDEQHEKSVILKVSRLLKRIGLKNTSAELKRITYCYLEILYAMLLCILNQKGSAWKKTKQDLNVLLCGLIRRHM